ncbi:MAG: histidine--tRNA ligase [Candidatus Helarchaeales archaeon]
MAGNLETTSKKLDLNRPAGFRDFLPGELRMLRTVESIVRRSIESYGYEEIQTPIVEFLDLFLIRSGEKFKQDTFTFKTPKYNKATIESYDAGEAGDVDASDAKTLVLRPEFTAGVCRFYIQNKISRSPKPVKIYYIGPCFRYDKPAPGRYRQFVQIGVEMFGADGAMADAEIIVVAMNTVKKIGIPDLVLRINDLNILRGLLVDFGISGEVQDKVIASMDKANGDLIKLELGFIDGIKEEIIEIFIKELDQMGLSHEAISLLEQMLYMNGSFKDIKPRVETLFEGKVNARAAIESSNLLVIEAILEGMGISSFVVDLSLARGLDYYTGIVFEIDSPSLGKQKQICGGGRYNRLIEEFGGESTPATGFAFGLDRLALAAGITGALNDKVDKSRSQVFIFAFSTDLAKELFKVQDALISKGIPAEVNVMKAKLRRALAFASKMGFQFAIIIGKREIDQGTITLKNLKTEIQQVITLEEAIDVIKNEISR